MGVKEEAINPRTLTHGVLSDIDSILEEVRQTSASDIVWNSLFAGWDDDDNGKFADFWMMAEADPYPENEFWDEYSEVRAAFTGAQGSVSSGYAGVIRMNEFFSPLWAATRRNYEAARYQYEVTGIQPIVRDRYTSQTYRLVSVEDYQERRK